MNALEVEKVTERAVEANAASCDELVQRGDRYLRTRKFDLARQCFRKVLELDPRHPSGHAGLGLVYYYRGDYRRAEEEFGVALEVDPEYAEAWNNLGAVLIAQERYEEAKKALEQALFLNPNLKDAVNQLYRLTRKPAFWDPLPTVSLCMIVRNEEASLPRCLSSVRDAVDEIIVVDTGSVDRTVDIALSFGARVFHYEWQNDFAAARNEALRHATGEWVLVLDADEEMKKEDVEKLKLLARITGVLGFGLPIRSLGERGNVIVNYMTRFFRNRPDIRFRRRVHEGVEPSIREIGGRIWRLTHVEILHHGYRDPKYTAEKAMGRNFALLFEALRENPKDPDILTYLGKSFLALGDKKKARALFEKAAKVSNGFLSKLVAYLDLASLDLMEGKPDEALEHLFWVKEQDPYLPDVYYLLGKAYEHKKLWREAIECFEKARSVDYRKSISLFFFAKFNLMDLFLSLVKAYLVAGEKKQALEVLEEWLGERVGSGKKLAGLGAELLQKGQFAEAEGCFRIALSENPRDPGARSGLFEVLLKMGRVEEAKQCLLELKNFL